MKKITVLIILGLSSFFVRAECPISINVKKAQYCVEVVWLDAETKAEGQYKPSNQPSPRLVPSGEVPQKWYYSKAQVKFWKKTDMQKKSMQIPQVNVFPFMKMLNGHHHPTGSDFNWDEQLQLYILSGFALQEMPGCWALNWEINSSNSQALFNIVNYKNLNDQQNKKIITLCQQTDQASQKKHSH